MNEEKFLKLALYIMTGFICLQLVWLAALILAGIKILLGLL